MSNSEEVLREMSRRCAGKNSQCSRPNGGKPTPCQGGICKDIAKYLRELCRAVLRGISTQLKADGRILSGCYGVQVADDASGARRSHAPLGAVGDLDIEPLDREPQTEHCHTLTMWCVVRSSAVQAVWCGAELCGAVPIVRCGAVRWRAVP